MTSTEMAVYRGRQQIERPANLQEALLAGQLSDHTRNAYRRDLRFFCEFIGGAEHLLEADRDTVTAYRNWLVEQGLAKTSINRRLSVVRMLFNEALLRGLVTRNPALGVKGLRTSGDSSPRAGLSAVQVATVLQSIPENGSMKGRRDLALFSLLVRTGLRREEAVSLKAGAVVEEDGYQVLHVTGKGNKTRRVKVPPDLAEMLKRWAQAAGLEAGEALFPAIRKGGAVIAGKAMSTQAVAAVVSGRVAAVLGEEWGKRITPHSLRHTFITLALAEGAPLHKAQYAAGHADPRTTLRYDRQRENLADSAVDYVTRALARVS